MAPVAALRHEVRNTGAPLELVACAGDDHFKGTGHQNLKLSKTVPIQTDKGMHRMIFSFTPVQKA